MALLKINMVLMTCTCKNPYGCEHLPKPPIKFKKLKYPSEMLVRLFEWYKPKGNIIDLGSGYGRHEKLSLEYGLVPITVDALNSGYMEKLEFNDKFFDNAIAWESLYYTNEKRSVEEMHRVLKPRGLAFIATNRICPQLFKKFKILDSGHFGYYRDGKHEYHSFFYVLRKP